MKTRTIAPKRYLVLSATLLEQELRDRLENETKPLSTPNDAIEFVVQAMDAKNRKHEEALKKLKPGQKEPELLYEWKFDWLKETNTVGILVYRGIEAALYFKRQYLHTSSDPEDVIENAPAKTLKSPDEAWIRVSLLEAKSAFKQSQFFTGDFDRVKEDRDNYKRLAASQATLIDQQGDRIMALERELTNLKGTTK